jgi:RNA polymerase sigma factor (sigma-70 family)
MVAFLDRKDEEAFEILVGRHEAMVLGACARVLGDEHGARDAAQAVFLVLARKGASLDLGRPLGPWLHHVAYGVAVSAYREREARRERERMVMNGSTGGRSSEESDGALREMLDGELDGLPEKYRRPLILFHLEGKSLEETARTLGSPAGTVGAWLSRGRELLRQRLVRRGAGAITGALLASFLAREAAAQAAGWGFARAAARAAAGGAVPPPVLTMTKGALNMMLFAKLKAAALALVAAGACLGANAALSSRASVPASASAEMSAPAPLGRSVEIPAIAETPITFEPFERVESPFPPTSDLVGHWKLDDEKGSTTAADATGKYPGKVVGGAVFAEGKLGGALKCDGKGGYVEIPRSEELDKIQEGSFSLAAWFKPENVPPGSDSANDASYAIIVKTGWHLGLYYTNEKKFTMTHWLAAEKPDEPIWTGIGAWDEEYEPGLWYHLVGTVDRPAGKVAIYLNGEFVKSIEFTPNAAAKKYPTETWKIGIGNPGAKEWSWPAKGSIDDVRIYGRAISAAEVKTLYEGK